MFDDPIVEAIRRVRRAHAAQFDNDLDAIVEDIRRLERASGRTYVNFPPRLLEKQATHAERQGPDSAMP
jgi:hypothetical protein